MFDIIVVLMLVFMLLLLLLLLVLGHPAAALGSCFLGPRTPPMMAAAARSRSSMRWL